MLLLTRGIVRLLDRVAPARGVRGHISTGRRGEDLAYFHLRGLGYTMVARNFRTSRHRGEIDLIGYDGETLCFIEVKTRTTRDVKPAEAAVDSEKQHDLKLVARDYLRRLKTKPVCRFDVVSVYLDTRPPEITLFSNAFPVS